MVVYRILCLVTGEEYIGMTSGVPKERFSTHKTYLRLKKHTNRYLQEAWNLYGNRSFILEVLEHCDSIEIAKQREIDYIVASDSCFNICHKKSKPGRKKRLGLDSRKSLTCHPNTIRMSV